MSQRQTKTPIHHEVGIPHIFDRVVSFFSAPVSSLQKTWGFRQLRGYTRGVFHVIFAGISAMMW